MMSLRMNPLSLIILHMIPGAFGGEWSLKYNQTEICALKGSTVSLNGTYTYPAGLEVKVEFWVIENFNRETETPVYCRTPTDSGRVQCSVDTQQHFSLTLSNVTKEDEHEYRYRIKTNVSKDKWMGEPVKISVTELHVNTFLEVIAREAAILTCTTTCSLTDSPTFIWYKNGRRLSSRTNPFHLRPVSSEHAGNYRCAVRGYEHLPSPDQILTVRYPPKNVSVSISPSGEIVENSSVILTCSSDANPPVQNYTWFKEGETSPVGSGQSYIITISSSSSGWYYCVAQNEHGEMKSASTEVTLKGHFYILPIVVGVGLCGVVVPLIIVLLMKRESLRRGKRQENSCSTYDTSSSPVYENAAALRKHHNENHHREQSKFDPMQSVE
ncbi:B-cell receptor CD22-like isoform X3 [Brachyhypopomus gauderio]|uniref:B-cell receptor CD22-like isoform X3 n=1 Tax=Brachyhypopomus gauderio TaxID=698409 RepID=UPI00404219D0